MSLPLEAMLFAFAGGFMYSIMLLYKDINVPRRNRNKKTNLFWIFFFLWPFAGALLVLAYVRSGSTMTGWPAMTAGFTAATTFQTMFNKSLNHNNSETNSN